MAASPVSRVAALALAALFLSGGGGASAVDAALFHRAGAGAVGTPPHVEAAGNPGCHAEQCVLALRLASGPEAPAPSLPVRFEGIPRGVAQARPAPAPYRFDPALHLQSRAPPLSLV